MTRKSIFLTGLIFGILLTVTSVSAAVSNVRVATNSSTYPIWEPTGAFRALDHNRTVEIYVLVQDELGMGVEGESVSLSYSPSISGAPTTATEVGSGVYVASFMISEDSSAATRYGSSVVSAGKYTITATASSVSGSSNFQVYYMLCNNCHWDGSKEVNMSKHQPNPSCQPTCHTRHGDVSEAAWVHSALIPGGGKGEPEMNWGTTNAPNDCRDCHDNTLWGHHNDTVGANNPTGGASCGDGPGGSSVGNCHGPLSLSKLPPYVRDVPKCTKCHKNLSYGTVTSEGAAPNTNTYGYAVSHINKSGGSNVPCAICHQGAHNFSLPKPGDSSINNQCKVCHSAQTIRSYRGPDCKGCHYTDNNTNGYLDSPDYLNVHDRDYNPNYAWDSNDASPEDNNDDPTTGVWNTGEQVTAEGSGFRAGQSVSIKLLDEAGNLEATKAITTNSTGGFTGVNLGKTLDSAGVWSINLSTDGSTYVLYDRFTVQSAVPEFPMGMGIATLVTVMVYSWKRKKYKRAVD